MRFYSLLVLNLIGTFNNMRLFAAEAQSLDPLDEDERAAIINTASIVAFEVQVGPAAHAASKRGHCRPDAAGRANSPLSASASAPSPRVR